MSVNEEITYDTILEGIGNCGKFQISRISLIVFILFTVHISYFNFVFYSLIPNYRCLIPSCENETYSQLEYQPDWLKNAVPFKNNIPQKCDMFEYIETNSTKCSKESLNNTSVIRCDKYVFDDSKFIGIAREFGIFCEDKLWMLTLPASIQFIGQFIDPLFGYLSDRFGRKTIYLTLCFITGVICQLEAYFAYNYYLLIFFEILQAIFRSGVLPIAFTLAMELVSIKHRSLTAFFVFMTQSFGQAILAIIAMYAPNWRIMIKISSFPTLFIIFYGWIIPESIRWLLAKNKNVEANNAIFKIAKSNGVEWNLDTRIKFESNSNLKKNELFMDLFKSPRIVQRILGCMACWFLNLFLYYGLMLGSVTIFGNLHLNFILASLMEIPGNLAALVFANLFGRKKTLFVSYLVLAAAILNFAFKKDEGWIKISFYLLGKCAVSTAFDCMYIYTAELFPTPFRQRILSICSAFGRFGAILSSLMPFLANIWVPLPFVLFGAASIIAGLITLMFSETLNSKLPDTISEALHIGDKNVTDKENVDK